jgi:hypothetical protein
VPNRENADPRRDIDLRDNAAPSEAKPKIEIDAPRRATLLSETAAPKLVNSITDSENKEPRRAIPNTAKADPLLATPLRDREAPKFENS